MRALEAGGDGPAPGEVGEGAEASLQDLLAPSPWIYWGDLLASAGVGWGSYWLACTAGSRAVAAAAGLVATLALYRAHLFIHELSHAARRLRGFEAAWNLACGFPMLIPSCCAVGVHGSHHGLRLFGTARDPEYLPFARSRGLIVRFLAQCALLPALMALRWLVLGPLGLLIPPLQRELERRATALAPNPAFVRECGPAQRRAILAQQLGVALFWAAPLTLLATGVWPARALWCWLAIGAGATVVNGLRTLASHRYDSGGEETDREGQLADSIDVPDGWWVELWAPVGHRYHALHHLMPAVPYHNLGAARRRLTAGSKLAPLLAASASDGLRSALGRLWSSAGGRRPDGEGPG